MMDKAERRDGAGGSGGIVTAVTLVALVVRLVLLVHVRVIETDSAYYGYIAGEFARGNFLGALNPAWPPFYPFIVGVLSRLNGDVALSAQVVSAVAGALLVPVVFRMTLILFGACAAVAASTLAAFHPRLILYSELFLTESLYTLLFATAAMLLIESLRRGTHDTKGGGSFRLVFPVLSGAFFFLTFVTRPEGLILFVSAVVFLAIASLVHQLGFRYARTLLVLLVSGFLLLFIPFSVVFHSATGRIVPGEKGRYNFYVTYRKDYARNGIGVSTGWINRIPPSRAVKGDSIGVDGMRSVPSYGDSFASGYNIIRFLRSSWIDVAGHTAKTFLRNVLDKLPSCEYHPLFILTLLGLLLPRKRYREEIVLGFMLISFILALSLFFSLRRFFVVLLPVLIMWAGVGFVQVLGRIPFFTLAGREELGVSGRYRERAGLVRFFSSLLVFVFLISSYSYSRHIVVNRMYHDEYRAAGEWLRDNFSAVPVLSSRKPEASFYAGARFVPLPHIEPGELESWMKREGVTHVLIDDSIMTASHPRLSGAVLGEDFVPDGLEKVYDRRIAGHRVVIFTLAGEER